MTASSPVFLARMDAVRAQLTGASQGGYAKTTGSLLDHETPDLAEYALDAQRAAQGGAYRWSESHREKRGVYSIPDAALRPQERALRALRHHAAYCWVEPEAAWAYLRGGRLGPTGVPTVGPVASAFNARMYELDYGVATVTRDRIISQAQRNRHVSGHNGDTLSPQP